MRFVYRHFAFLGQESVWAAQATECAADQQRFWAYHDRLFEIQVPQHNVGNFSMARLEQVATSLGLDSGAFKGCLESGRYAAYVQQASSAARERGVTGTPTLFANGVRFKTPDTFEALVQALS